MLGLGSNNQWLTLTVLENVFTSYFVHLYFQILAQLFILKNSKGKSYSN